MVNVKGDGINRLKEKIPNKKLICFGAGSHFDTVMNLYKSYDLASHIVVIIDNDIKLKNTIRKWNDKEFLVESMDYVEKEVNPEDYVILITSHLYSMEIVRQLDCIKSIEGLEVYIGSFLSDNLNHKSTCSIERKMSFRIPKIIHYCWFGENNVPQEYERYIETWQRLCPDYKIKIWNENNFDIDQNKYMLQAYNEKKWAFVSDYARLKIIYDEGGIYLDCDVELLKPLDNFLGYDMFCGFEDDNHINFGLGFGAVRNHKLLSELLDVYDSLEFLKEDGTLNLTPCTAYQTEVITQNGFEANNTFQCHNNIAVLPTEILAPISPWGINNTNDYAYSIHHYSASWQDEKNLAKIKQVYIEYCCRVNKV